MATHKLSFHIPASLHEALQKRCVKDGKSMTRYIVELLGASLGMASGSVRVLREELRVVPNGDEGTDPPEPPGDDAPGTSAPTGEPSFDTSDVEGEEGEEDEEDEDEEGDAA